MSLLWRATLLLGCALFCSTATQAAPPPETAAPESSAFKYVIPDLRADKLLRDGERFWFKPVINILLDYTWLDQDSASLEQVGYQEDSRDLRGLRVGFDLRSKGRLKWSLFFATDFQERRTRDGEVFNLLDLRFGIPLGPVKLDIGRLKQRFVLEVLPFAVQSPQQERILSPFYVTRSNGVQLSGHLAGDRMTWAAGWFNDWLDTDLSFSENADDYAGRLTGLVFVSPDDQDYLHLGLGLRRVGSDAGVMRFSGRPGSNVTDKYLDTGEFPASHAWQLSLEALWDRGPFMLVAEHVESRVQASESGDPRFSGSYLMASWVVTGESRSYRRAVGYPGGLVPARRGGALELVVRVSHVDLTYGELDGGVLDHTSFGINWWASRQWKVGLSYGDADLDKGGILGNTKMLLARLQWAF